MEEGGEEEGREGGKGKAGKGEMGERKKRRGREGRKKGWSLVKGNSLRACSEGDCKTLAGLFLFLILG